MTDNTISFQPYRGRHQHQVRPDKTEAGRDLGPCVGADTSEASSKDFPPDCLFGGATEASSKDFPPDCLFGGATEASSKDFPPDCLFGSDTAEASSKDFPPDCLFGAETEAGYHIAGRWSS